MALYRGHMNSRKKMVTKEALASLETVKLEDLQEDERTCTICYNEIGVENPDGLTENPLRLPKCRHIFGEKCIKKWFEDSNSCPYCRATLPSEVPSRRAHVIESLREAQLLQREQRYTSVAATAAASFRNRGYGGPARYLFSEDDTRRSVNQRLYEDYEQMINRENVADAWGSSPNRASAADSPEGRRRARGRVGGNRAPHMLGRPTSVGSARYNNSNTTHQSSPARALFSNNGNHGISHTSRRSITPAADISQARHRAFAPSGDMPPLISDVSSGNPNESWSNFRDGSESAQISAHGIEDLFESVSNHLPSDFAAARPGVQRSHSAAYHLEPPLSSAFGDGVAAHRRAREIALANANANTQPRWPQ